MKAGTSKGKPSLGAAEPVCELLQGGSKSTEQRKWIKEALEVVAAPTSSSEARLAALAEIEQRMAVALLNGGAAAGHVWWQGTECNIVAALLSHLHVLHLHLALLEASPLRSSASGSGSSASKLVLGARGGLEAIAEEVVTCLSILQGLVVSDCSSRLACTSRVALESILLLLSAPLLASSNILAPSCHALDLLMCILVDADDQVSDRFEALGGVDQISTVWKNRAEALDTHRAALQPLETNSRPQQKSLRTSGLPTSAKGSGKTRADEVGKGGAAVTLSQGSEPDELCEKCIEFLVFYLQPELLEKEAIRERRRKEKATSNAAAETRMAPVPGRTRARPAKEDLQTAQKRHIDAPLQRSPQKTRRP